MKELITFFYVIILWPAISFAEVAPIAASYLENRERHRLMAPVESAAPNEKLKLVTINLGLLKSPSEVPNFGQRSGLLLSVISNFLASENPDIVFLQEAWKKDKPENVKKLRTAAHNNGYFSVQELLESSVQELLESSGQNPSDQARNGLEILVKESIVNWESPLAVGFDRLARTKMEFVGGYERGLLHATFRLTSGKTVFAATSHFTPNLAWPSYNQNKMRKTQVKQAAAIIAKKAPNLDLVVFGADLNFSPEFAHKINDGRSLDTKDSAWQANALNYSLFLTLTGLVDTYQVLHSDPGYTQDREYNPMANASPSTDGEPEQRLDYIWAGTGTQRALQVVSSQLIFDTPLVDEQGSPIPAQAYKGDLFLSDHFGVVTELAIY